MVVTGMSCGRHIREQILVVPHYRQKTSVWCWAAASEMMIEYYLHKHIRQCQQVDDWLDKTSSTNHPECCAPSIPAQCTFPGGLTFLLYDYNFDSSRLAWNDIKHVLDRGQPFASVWKFDGSTNHYTVTFGYVEIDNQRWVLLHDPLYDDHWIETSDAFDSGPGYRRSGDVYNLRLP
jgi:hypothetical protein